MLLYSDLSVTNSYRLKNCKKNKYKIQQCIKWWQLQTYVGTLLTFLCHHINVKVKTMQTSSWDNENVFHDTYIIKFQYQF
jgi:hypothetical protein